jgi:hypothetical protein
MLIKTSLLPSGFDAFTCWPFIFIRPQSANNTGLIKHEMVHYREQGVLSLVWLMKYFLSKQFRLQAEVRAYKVQIACGGIALLSAASMLLKYRLGITTEEAIKYLTEEKPTL